MSCLQKHWHVAAMVCIPYGIFFFDEQRRLHLPYFCAFSEQWGESPIWIAFLYILLD
jgi:hypothetical protein